MKSKPDQVKPKTAEKQKVVKTYDYLDVNEPFDFVGLYKTVDETNNILEKYKTNDSALNNTAKSNLKSPKREHTHFKRNKKSTREQEPIAVSKVNIDASSLTSDKGAYAEASPYPTPNKSVQHPGASVKSIMKNDNLAGQSADSARSSKNKPKKRNKSVSFMLDDAEEVMVKRTKSDDLIDLNKKTENTITNKKKRTKKLKKNQPSEKENTVTEVKKQNMEIDSSPIEVAEATGVILGSSSSNGESSSVEKKKKFKKIKKKKPVTNESVSNNKDVETDTKGAKALKKKKPVKQTITNNRESGDGDDEPVSKSRKTETNPDIAEDLENLSIGDNAHTLSSMLDEMTVVDKEKRKKMKQKFNKNKKQRSPVEEDKTEEVKEKVKWKKRKWNKDKKGEISSEGLDTMIIVEGLPIKIMLNYKKLLSDYFVKYGLIKRVGMAEVYPSEEPKPVFTTTIIFNSDGAAEMALEENNSIFEGSRIRVKRPLPPTETTIVVRSYAELTDQNISSAFLGLGKIRSIKHLVKGKKSQATAFVEFDGPEAVQRAISKTADFKIGGKRVHVAKFEPRQRKKKEKKPKSEDSAADADSEDSCD